MNEARVIPLHGLEQGKASPRNGPARKAVRRRGTHSEALPRVAPVIPSQPESPDDAPAIPASTPEQPEPLSALFDFLRRRLVGDYPIDEFGFDRELTDALLLPPMRALYQKWFRVEVSGAANLPVTGGALLVANHSGTVPLDAAMAAVAVHDNHPDHRYLRILAADLVFATPLLGSLARKSGQTLACHPDAERLLRAGELVGVWPEGFKGIGKPFSRRYQLQRFGRGGFVAAALRTGVPIVPVSIVGAEEIYPKIADLKPLARLLGLPYFPITPLFPVLGPLGMVPQPSKWHIDFGEPIDVSGTDPEDPMLLFNLTDQVRASIQQTLHRLIASRGNPFFA